MPLLFELKSGREGQTGIHRLDVRTKLAVSLLASVAVIFLNHPGALGLLVVFSTVYVASLKRLKILMVIYVAIILMGCMAVGMMAGLTALWPKTPSVDPGKLLVPFLRTLVMVNTALALALSSRIQSLMAALKVLRLPFCIYVPLVVMVRFIPTLIEDIRQIRECIRTKGYGLTPLSLWAHPWITIRLLLMPLLFRSLRSSDELGIAAELKGMGYGQQMTPLKKSRFGRKDIMMVCMALVVLALSLILQHYYREISGGTVI